LRFALFIDISLTYQKKKKKKGMSCEYEFEWVKSDACQGGKKNLLIGMD